MIASAEDHFLTVRELLNAGEVDTRNKYGRTPLMFASHYGFTSIVKELISSGVDLNLKNIHGWTALYVANLKDRKDIQSILIESEAIE